ncbi:transmembrane and coiled-coil domains protein 2 isoform X1 [Anastrepha ludens]|uniref:transmembrane and coiled-coil domains protein 2 isoform X1 n=1 Tax=Anastrepha ludens TaxID=28586 RepID=UPI0023AF5868|nr:transmembrane and coiled-coil domains protein 2 isoform X1 [Anastrepha ludens]XP_053956340.1 transmembrane and coiled-coil domains protein 2 isoform X1 [Anastrepha ludens]XP_053956345.1 transmembrane and coiled-coil domains protein 2 isoform X1 [Anastrepha ludens]
MDSLHVTSTAGGSGTQLSSLLSTTANIATTSTAKDHHNLLLLSQSGGSGQLRISRSPSDARSSEQMSRERNHRGDSTDSASHADRTATAVTSATVASAAVGTIGTLGGAGASGTSLATTTSTGGVSSYGSSTMTGCIGSGSSGATVATFRGFRSHSPSSRRSRERSRREFQRTHGSDQGGLLAYSGLSNLSAGGISGGGGVGGVGVSGGGISGGIGGFIVGSGDGSTMESMGGVGVEDSRLSGTEDLCYQSFASDEQDGSHVGVDGNKKHHRRHERTSSLQALDRLNTKIQCTKESIRKEQTARDDNVNEYLKLAASADKQQLQRIKAVFEKKNQKSAHSISQLQKKLDNYTKRAKDLSNHQFANKSQHRQPREVLRDVGQGLRNVGGNIRDGITGFSGSVMSKPREFAHLIKNKFGSADNINQMSETEINNINMPVNAELIGSSTPNNNIAATSTGSGNTGGAGSGKFNSDNGSECSSVTSESIPAGSGKSQSGASQYHLVLKSLLTELTERKDEIEKLKERVERLETAQKEFNNLTATLEGERYRAESLEEQINDLTELHQNEIENLKQTIADMEEKVQYQSDERLRDVNEVLENCQTRISKMEHLSQQQYVTVEGIDNSNARALVVKLINVVLTVLQVVLLLVATAAGIIMPFLKTRVRVLTTFLFIFFIIFVIRQWPDVQDIGAGLMRHLKESLVVK